MIRRTRGSRACGRGLICLLLSSTAAALPASEFFVDCPAGDDAADGRSPQTAWASLSRVELETFSPGDAIRLRRGTRCEGTLRPRGSGAPDRPVVLGTYGVGSLPVIDAGDHEAAVRLFNQHHWHIRNLETNGGSRFGIHVSGDVAGVLEHIRIVDVVVHDVGGIATNKESGLIVVSPGSADTTFDDVVIDGATAHTTTQWAGILVGGDDFGGTPTSPRSTNVTIRNCTVHDVYGDGIVLFQVDHGLIETSVAYATGQAPTTDVGTPNGIWTWMCGDCTVQFNEGYATDSPGVDGGVFDIDYGCTNNVVQFNYAHDAAAYCVSVFGAHSTTRDSVVRYNVCSNNARDPSKAYQGEIYLFTWAGGRIDGVQVYNNTVYWNPALDAPAINIAGASFTGGLARLFKNNIIYSTTPLLARLSSDAGIEFDHNLYWSAGADPPEWEVSGVAISSFEEWQAGGFDPNGVYADPLLVDPAHPASGPGAAFRPRFDSPVIDAGAFVEGTASHDFDGAPVPFGSACDIGAVEWSPEPRGGPGPILWRSRPGSRRPQRDADPSSREVSASKPPS